DINPAHLPASGPSNPLATVSTLPVAKIRAYYLREPSDVCFSKKV
ncbi:MAG: hypothetical protein ACI8W8_003906, partial [Rhodothermales bacterium]